MRSNLSRLQNKTHSWRGATVSESSIVEPVTLWGCTISLVSGERGTVNKSGGSLFTEEHRRLDTDHGITSNVLIIEGFASAYVEYKYFELIPVHVIMQLARFCHALHMELSRRDKRRARAAYAQRSLCGRCGPTCEMVRDGGDGCAGWTRAKFDGEDGEGLGANSGRVVISGLVGTTGPQRGLVVWVRVGIRDGSSTIDLLKFIDGGKCLGKLYGGNERRAWG